MRLSISNLAWDREEDNQVAAILNQFGVDAIDIAPGKYFPSPADATENDIEAVRNWWSERGVEIIGMQALLFGTVGLNLFASAEIQQKMLDHLAVICRIAGRIGATRLAFGSPKNRDRSGLSDEQVLETAIPFFTRLGDIASGEGVWVCLEPNPVRYGANFMTTSVDTAAIVRAVDHGAIKMQIDTGAIAMNGEDPEAILKSYGNLAGHIHLSEPDLVPLGDGSTDHARCSAAIKNRLPNQIATIEMLTTKDEPHSISIERAIGVARQYYQ